VGAVERAARRGPDPGFRGRACDERQRSGKRPVPTGIPRTGPRSVDVVPGSPVTFRVEPWRPGGCRSRTRGPKPDRPARGRDTGEAGRRENRRSPVRPRPPGHQVVKRRALSPGGTGRRSVVPEASAVAPREAPHRSSSGSGAPAFGPRIAPRVDRARSPPGLLDRAGDPRSGEPAGSLRGQIVERRARARPSSSPS
jgi:hypothetical protein